MKSRAAFLLTLLLLVQAVRPGAWASRAMMPEETAAVSSISAVCAQPEQKEGCCEIACPCCPETAPAPVDCSCEASPAEPGTPVSPAAPPPVSGRDASPPLLTEWRSPAPPCPEPAADVTGTTRALWIKRTALPAGKVRACVRHCALLI